jgi:hypothetical protein
MPLLPLWPQDEPQPLALLAVYTVWVLPACSVAYGLRDTLTILVSRLMMLPSDWLLTTCVAADY